MSHRTYLDPIFAGHAFPAYGLRSGNLCQKPRTILHLRANSNVKGGFEKNQEKWKKSLTILDGNVTSSDRRKRMLILELSQRTGISRHTIRYYEKYGLIHAEQRRENSYKEYGEAALYSLIFVDPVKKLGFSLFEIRDFLHLLARSRKEASVVMEAKMATKLEELDAKIQAMKKVRGDVNALLMHCRSNPEKGSEGIKDLVHSMEKKAMVAGISENSSRPKKVRKSSKTAGQGKHSAVSSTVNQKNRKSRVLAK